MPSTTTPSGLIIDEVVVGEGAAATAGRSVTVHYTGWLMYGGAAGKKEQTRRSGFVGRS